MSDELKRPGSKCCLGGTGGLVTILSGTDGSLPRLGVETILPTERTFGKVKVKIA